LLGHFDDVDDISKMSSILVPIDQTENQNNATTLNNMTFMRKRRIISALLLCVSIAISYISAWSEPRIVGGQRCLYIPSQTTPTDSCRPPLVLVGGLAQSIASYESHLPFLSKKRSVLVYECRGQGHIEVDENDDDDYYYANVTLPFQAESLLQTVDNVIGDETKVDLVGFSLGARIIMAAACVISTDSSRIRKMHLTGVATQRSSRAQVALEAWKQLTQNENLQGFAWSALQTTYSDDFLLSNKDRLNTWVDYLCNSNSCRGIYELLQQTHPESKEDPWHVCSMAKRLVDKNSNIKGKLVAGELDVMAPPMYAQELATLLQWEVPTVVPKSGHAVPMEAGRAWRQDVIMFLDME
jgi:pimeloyl-ACP methyl ester carboxylesterase